VRLVVTISGLPLRERLANTLKTRPPPFCVSVRLSFN